jgi:hypothetical protein
MLRVTRNCASVHYGVARVKLAEEAALSVFCQSVSLIVVIKYFVTGSSLFPFFCLICHLSFVSRSFSAVRFLLSMLLPEMMFSPSLLGMEW